MLQQHFNYYAESIQVYVHQSIIIITFKNTHYLVSILHMYSFTVSNNSLLRQRNWKKKEKKIVESTITAVQKDCCNFY